MAGTLIEQLEKREKAKELRLQGWSLREIAQEFGVTHAAVGYWLRGVDKPKKITKPKVTRRSMVEAAAQSWGLSVEDYIDIRDKYGTSEVPSSPFKRYRVQQKNADRRGVGWNFTFSTWWAKWQTSGKWCERGRGAGYCMARDNDEGPYSPENVTIIFNAENARQYRRKMLCKTF